MVQMIHILTNGQKNILERLPVSLKDNFVFSGGTALAAFYLGHRLSDDLDFFGKVMEQDLYISEIEGILKKHNFDIDSVNKIYDRCIFSVRIEDEQIKLAFVPQYFKRLQPPIYNDGFNIHIESLKDLTTNKIIAMADRFEIKDYVDIFYIAQQTNWRFVDMINLAQQKLNMPYAYTIDLSRITSKKKLFNSIQFTTKVDPEQIIEFFDQSNKEIQKMLLQDFDPLL
jgi:predicted nucleotidyltransferase component of viral defense system